MTLRRITARGAIWNIGAGLLTRVVGLAGTVIITHHLSPAQMGEVAAATILAFTANWLSSWGFNQYIVVRGTSPADVWHVTVLHLVCGMIAFGALPLVGGQFTTLLNAPHLTDYLPGMLVATALKRIAAIPDKLLLRELRFRTVAVANGIGELTYVSLAVTLVATTHLGGQGIVIANIVQAAVVAAIEISALGLRTWLTPAKWEWRRVADIFRFGAPLAVNSVLGESSRYWDKLMMSRLFGPHATGAYSLSYNLSDLPATYVGEHVATVLFPTFARVDADRRKDILYRAIGLLTLIILPMAFGMAAVAPTMVATLFSAEWRDLTPFLVVLATVAIFRPINAVLALLLIASEKNQVLMRSEIGKAALVFIGMWLLARWGPVASAAAIGLAMCAQTIGVVAYLGRSGVSLARLGREVAGPVAAAAVMAVAVVASRVAMTEWTQLRGVLELAAEVLVGALSYGIAIWVLARAKVLVLLQMAREQFGRRFAGGGAPA